jgi:hypothetical protein
VQPGQNIIITGDISLAEPPSWGEGGFVVQQFGSLALSRVRLATVSRRFFLRRQTFF